MIEVAGAIVENGQGQILLAQRPPHKTLAGMWEFPGGKLEPGETPEAAVARELEEELHLKVHIRRNMGAFDYSYEWGAIRLHVLVAVAQSEPRPTADVQVFRWTQPSDLNSSELAPADREPLVQYLRQQSGPEI